MGKKSKVLKKLDAPQKYVFDKIADSAGVKTGKTSEETARNLVEKAAAKLGLGDSTAANAVKALGVAGLSVAGDPLNLIPGAGPAKKVAKMLGKVSKSAPKAAKTLNKASLPSGAWEKAAPAAIRAEKTAELGKTLSKKPVNMAKVIKENDVAAQKERIRRVLRSDDRVNAAKSLSSEDKKAFKKALLKYKKTNQEKK